MNTTREWAGSDWAKYRTVKDAPLTCQDPDCKHHLDYHFLSKTSEGKLTSPCMWRACKCANFHDITPVDKRHRL